MKPAHRSAGIGMLITILLSTSGCYPGSDNQYAQAQAKARAAEATRSLRLATQQTVRGRPVAGPEIKKLVSERTWIKEYPRFPNGEPGPHRTYEYFRQDGQFIWADNWIYRAFKPVAGDRWRVDGDRDRLCVLHQHYSHIEKCYSVALDANNGIQLYIDEPGEANHGLITRTIRQTIAGAPEL